MLQEWDGRAPSGVGADATKETHKGLVLVPDDVDGAEFAGRVGAVKVPALA
jgi:hypothetical protein